MLRNSLQIRATSLDEKEKVSLDGFPVMKSLPVHDALNQGTTESLNDTPGVLERWVVKSEQLVNVALTVRVFLHSERFFLFF